MSEAYRINGYVTSEEREYNKSLSNLGRITWC